MKQNVQLLSGISGGVVYIDWWAEGALEIVWMFTAELKYWELILS